MPGLNKENGKLKVAVIEGFHPFEVPQWMELFQQIEGADFYFQTIDNWAVDCAGCRNEYDVSLFYNMNMSLDESPFKDQLINALDELKQNQKGKIILHHALLSWPEMSLWSELVGIEDRKFDYHPEQNYSIQVANKEHPITEGIDDWSIEDETYTMANAESGNEILLTADYSNSMNSIAWTRVVDEARVFCFQCGHDHLAWENPNFIEILKRSILWCAHKI